MSIIGYLIFISLSLNSSHLYNMLPTLVRWHHYIETGSMTLIVKKWFWTATHLIWMMIMLSEPNLNEVIYTLRRHVALVAITGTTILLFNIQIMLVQLIWRSGNNRFHLWVSDLQINGLVPERCNSITDALELCLSCTYPSKWSAETWLYDRVPG